MGHVFQMKKKALIDLIHKRGIFGTTVAYVYTIEFQKRGLPHIHMLIFLKESFKLNSAQAIDSCIWARWPDPDTAFIVRNHQKVCDPWAMQRPQPQFSMHGKC